MRISLNTYSHILNKDYFSKTISLFSIFKGLTIDLFLRSEERRVGKECSG